MKLPKVTPGFAKQVRSVAREEGMLMHSLAYTNSGDLTSGVTGALMGPVMHTTGKIQDLILSVGNQGRDDTDDLTLVADVKVNGSSVLSGEAKPTIVGASGEAGAATFASVSSFSSADVSKGDRVTLDLSLTRTTPDTEIQDIQVGVVISELS